MRTCANCRDVNRRPCVVPLCWPVASTLRQRLRTDPSLTSAALPRSAGSGSRLRTSAESGSGSSSVPPWRRWRWSCAGAPCSLSWTELPLTCAPGCSCGWVTGRGGSSSAQPVLPRPRSGRQVLRMDLRFPRFPVQLQPHCCVASPRWGPTGCVSDRSCWFLCSWVCCEKVSRSKTRPGRLCKVGI